MTQEQLFEQLELRAWRYETFSISWNGVPVQSHRVHFSCWRCKHDLPQCKCHERSES